MEISLTLQIGNSFWILAFNPEDFTLTPGVIESGTNAPAEWFDAPSDKYWLWGWLGFTIMRAWAEE